MIFPEIKLFQINIHIVKKIGINRYNFFKEKLHQSLFELLHFMLFTTIIREYNFIKKTMICEFQ